MSKIITSPVAKWPGTVTLFDPLTYPQVIAFQDVLKLAGELDEDVSVVEANYILLPGIFTCVETWQLEDIGDNPTVDTFPATPGRSAGELVAWLITEISRLFTEAEEVPKEL